VKANPVRFVLVESLEARALLSATLSLGDDVSQVAKSSPGAAATLVHATQAAYGTGFGQIVSATARGEIPFPGQ
jgi:hypothetical protein